MKTLKMFTLECHIANIDLYGAPSFVLDFSGNLLVADYGLATHHSVRSSFSQLPQCIFITKADMSVLSGIAPLMRMAHKEQLERIKLIIPEHLYPKVKFLMYLIYDQLRTNKFKLEDVFDIQRVGENFDFLGYEMNTYCITPANQEPSFALVGNNSFAYTGLSKFTDIIFTKTSKLTDVIAPISVKENSFCMTMPELSWLDHEMKNRAFFFNEQGKNIELLKRAGFQHIPLPLIKTESIANYFHFKNARYG